MLATLLLFSIFYGIKTKIPYGQLYLVLPITGKMSALVKSGLVRSSHKCLPFCKVKHVSKTSNCLKNYFNFKDIVPKPLHSCQIYNFMYGSCNASYIGKTFRHMKVRFLEYQDVSAWTDKHLIGTLSTSVRYCMLVCNHSVAWDEFRVLRRITWNTWKKDKALNDALLLYSQHFRGSTSRALITCKFLKLTSQTQGY